LIILNQSDPETVGSDDNEFLLFTDSRSGVDLSFERENNNICLSIAIGVGVKLSDINRRIERDRTA
jgi:hypothetical protein